MAGISTGISLLTTTRNLVFLSYQTSLVSSSLSTILLTALPNPDTQNRTNYSSGNLTGSLFRGAKLIFPVPTPIKLEDKFGVIEKFG